MNRRRIELAALVVGVGAVVRRRLRSQVDPGSTAPDSDGNADTASTESPLPEGDKASSADHSGQPLTQAVPSESEIQLPKADGEAVADQPMAQAVLGEPEIHLPESDEASSADHSGQPLTQVVLGAPEISIPSAGVEPLTTPEISVPSADDDPASAEEPPQPPAIVLPTMPRAGTREIVDTAVTIPAGDDEIDEITDKSTGESAVAEASSSSPDVPDTAPFTEVPPIGARHEFGSPDVVGDRSAAGPGGPKSPTRKRRLGWSIFGGVALAILVAAVIAASVVPLPYYSLRPGSVYDTIERVEAPGDLVSIPNGEIGFVTVSQTANISTWQWLDAKLDGTVSIRHEDEVEGDQTADELREANIRRMQVSKDSAVVVALRKLGYDLVVTPIGIEVAQVFACTAADGTLGTGDLIVGLNGADVRDSAQLVEQLGAVSIGDEIELLVERIDPNNPTQSMRTDLVGITLGSADAACLPDDVRSEEARPFIGIGTLTIVDEDFPIDINVRTGRVSGPSAGLAFTLAIIDVLSEGELTNGLSIVATGTIDRDGNVGPVGGIHQKTVAAERSGADIFIVPACCDNFVSRASGEPLDLPSNYEEALLYAEDMLVVGVDTLDEALIAIGEIGGDVDQFLDL